MARFVFLALPLLLLVLALGAFSADVLGMRGAGIGGLALLWQEPVSGRLLLSTWLLEALGLVVLFLLVQSRGDGAWAIDGLATGAIAWLFRGPILVLTVAGTARLGREPWFTLSLQRLVVYLAGGLLLAVLAQRVGLRR